MSPMCNKYNVNHLPNKMKPLLVLLFQWLTCQWLVRIDHTSCNHHVCFISCLVINTCPSVPSISNRSPLCWILNLYDLPLCYQPSSICLFSPFKVKDNSLLSVSPIYTPQQQQQHTIQFLKPKVNHKSLLPEKFY